MSEFTNMVRAELIAARAKFAATDLGYKHGKPHYFYAVIYEELDEFWDLVRSDAADKDPDGKFKMLKELVQISAMAQRAAEDMGFVEPESFGEFLKCGECFIGIDHHGNKIDSGPCLLNKGHSGSHSSNAVIWGSGVGP